MLSHCRLGFGNPNIAWLENTALLCLLQIDDTQPPPIHLCTTPLLGMSAHVTGEVMVAVA